ncbi:MAG: TonB-dependent receptor [Pseudomonadales bacterium]|nr:TonB-dependent receptor [Pseudomonadales bacterium]
MKHHTIIPAALLSLLSAQLYADSADLHADNSMEVVTVTASRTPVSIDDTGSAVTIISHDQITSRGYVHIADLLREVAGIAVSQQGGRGTITQVRMRGAEANQVLVLIDGMEVNDPSQGGEFNFASLTTAQVDRIEIVRGAQSAIWGSDAMAGVINIITATPDTQGHRVSASAETGSSGHRQLSADWQYSHEQLTLSLVGEGFSTDGTNISRRGSEDDGFRNKLLQVRAGYALADSLQVAMQYRATDSETDFDGTDFLIDGLPTDTDYSANNEQRLAGLHLDWQQSDTLNHRLSLTRLNTDNETDNGNPDLDITRGEKQRIAWQTDWQLNGHTLSGLLERETEHYQQRGTASFFGNPNKSLDAHTASAALEYRYNATDFDYSLSVRQENNSHFDNATSWRTTARWQWLTGLSVYGSFGKAVKNPGFTERFGYYDSFVGNPDLAPEVSLSAEIGLYGTFGESLTFMVNHFRSRLDDEINGFSFDPNTGGFTAINQREQSHRRGAELDLSWQILDGTLLELNYTYLDASEQDQAVAEVRRPRHSGSLRASRHWSAVQLSAGLNYTGQQTDDYFPPFAPYFQKVRLDSYLTLDINLRYDVSPALQLSLRGLNLTDTDYEEVYGYASAGRSLMLGANYTF